MIVQCHQLIDLGDDAALLGEGWEGDEEPFYLTQEQFAEVSGFSQQYILDGATAIPRDYTLRTRNGARRKPCGIGRVSEGWPMVVAGSRAPPVLVQNPFRLRWSARFD